METLENLGFIFAVFVLCMSVFVWNGIGPQKNPTVFFELYIQYQKLNPGTPFPEFKRLATKIEWTLKYKGPIDKQTQIQWEFRLGTLYAMQGYLFDAKQKFEFVKEIAPVNSPEYVKSYINVHAIHQAEHDQTFLYFNAAPDPTLDVLYHNIASEFSIVRNLDVFESIFSEYKNTTPERFVLNLCNKIRRGEPLSLLEKYNPQIMHWASILEPLCETVDNPTFREVLWILRETGLIDCGDHKLWL